MIKLVGYRIKNVTSIIIFLLAKYVAYFEKSTDSEKFVVWVKAKLYSQEIKMLNSPAEYSVAQLFIFAK